MKTIDYTSGTNKTFQVCFDILKHYECSNFCLGDCCKVDTISFSQGERKHILKKYPEARDIILRAEKKTATTRINTKVSIYTFSEHPCPFLNNNLCSIHDDAPLICRSYPFTVGKGEPDGYITLAPCFMGIEVMKDYILMSSYLGADVVQNIINLNIVMEDARGRDRTVLDNNAKLFYVPFVYLPALLDFLNSYSTEERLEGKRKLGIA